MKIIDKTPLVNEQGQLGFLQRLQGMLKYGFSWPGELEAQKAIMTFFDRQLEKGYTLIRNVPLGASGIVVPMILLGPPGIYVIHVTFLRGRYEARANSWNEASGDGYKPARVNLVQQTARMAKAVTAFIERQGLKVPVEVEPVLIAANPGLHVESVRPAIKVIMIDGVKSFAAGLSSATPVLKTEAVHEFAERIVNPRLPHRERVAASPSQPRPASQEVDTEPPAKQVSRARAIFNAAEEAKPFNPADFDFAMFDEGPAPAAATSGASIQESSPAQPLPPAATGRKRRLGMTPLQLVIVVALGLAVLCILAVFAVLVLNPTLLFP
jgi:Nuclease-related domain